jgi:hypothetical protein
MAGRLIYVVVGAVWTPNGGFEEVPVRSFFDLAAAEDFAAGLPDGRMYAIPLEPLEAPNAA